MTKAFDFLSLSSQEKEDLLRTSFRKMFQNDKKLIDANKHLLSEESAAEARAQWLARPDKPPIEVFELWLRVLREEMKKASSEMA